MSAPFAASITARPQESGVLSRIGPGSGDDVREPDENSGEFDRGKCGESGKVDSWHSHSGS